MDVDATEDAEQGPERDWRYGKSIPQLMEYIFYNDEGTRKDVKFVVGPSAEEIHAHKFFLSYMSPVFEEMFRDSGHNDRPTIPLPDVDPSAFRTLLKYIYTRHVLLTELDDTLELLSVACRFKLYHLAKKAGMALAVYIDEENVINILERSLALGAQELKKKALAKICSLGVNFLRDASILECSLNGLSAILDCEDLAVPEVEIFKMAVRWAENQIRLEMETHDVKIRGEQIRAKLGQALYLIRFPLLSREEFASLVVKLRARRILLDPEILQVYSYHDSLLLPPGSFDEEESEAEELPATVSFFSTVPRRPARTTSNTSSNTSSTARPGTLIQTPKKRATSRSSADLENEQNKRLKTEQQSPERGSSESERDESSIVGSAPILTSTPLAAASVARNIPIVANLTTTDDTLASSTMDFEMSQLFGDGEGEDLENGQNLSTLSTRPLAPLVIPPAIAGPSNALQPLPDEEQSSSQSQCSSFRSRPARALSPLDCFQDNSSAFESGPPHNPPALSSVNNPSSSSESDGSSSSDDEPPTPLARGRPRSLSERSQPLLTDQQLAYILQNEKDNSGNNLQSIYSVCSIGAQEPSSQPFMTDLIYIEKPIVICKQPQTIFLEALDLPQMQNFKIDYLINMDSAFAFRSWLEKEDIQRSIMFFKKFTAGSDDFPLEQLWIAQVNVDIKINGLHVLEIDHEREKLLINRINAATESIIAGLNFDTNVREVHLEDVKISDGLSAIPSITLDSLTLRKVRGIKTQSRQSYLVGCPHIRSFSCDDFANEVFDFGLFRRDKDVTAPLSRLALAKARLSFSMDSPAVLNMRVEELYLDRVTIVNEDNFVEWFPDIFTRLKRFMMTGGVNLKLVVAVLEKLETLEWVAIEGLEFVDGGLGRGKRKSVGKSPIDYAKNKETMIQLLTNAGLGNHENWLNHKVKSFILEKVNGEWRGRRIKAKNVVEEFGRLKYENFGWDQFYSDFTLFKKMN